jgi:hypothetical protein
MSVINCKNEHKGHLEIKLLTDDSIAHLAQAKPKSPARGAVAAAASAASPSLPVDYRNRRLFTFVVDETEQAVTQMASVTSSHSLPGAVMLLDKSQRHWKLMCVQGESEIACPQLKTPLDVARMLQALGYKVNMQVAEEQSKPKSDGKAIYSIDGDENEGGVSAVAPFPMSPAAVAASSSVLPPSSSSVAVSASCFPAPVVNWLDSVWWQTFPPIFIQSSDESPDVVLFGCNQCQWTCNPNHPSFKGMLRQILQNPEVEQTPLDSPSRVWTREALAAIKARPIQRVQKPSSPCGEFTDWKKAHTHEHIVSVMPAMVVPEGGQNTEEGKQSKPCGRIQHEPQEKWHDLGNIPIKEWRKKCIQYLNEPPPKAGNKVFSAVEKCHQLDEELSHKAPIILRHLYVVLRCIVDLDAIDREAAKRRSTPSTRPKEIEQRHLQEIHQFLLKHKEGLSEIAKGRFEQQEVSSETAVSVPITPPQKVRLIMDSLMFLVALEEAFTVLHHWNTQP